ncbi:membrane protein [Bacteroidales bacterium]|nr:membrane protein [Bacteroidales bacterium]
MIQRIQTIYLLLIAGFMLAILFLPLGSFIKDGEVASFNCFGLTITQGTGFVKSEWTLFYLAIASSLISFSAVFLYKKRNLQVGLSYLMLMSLVMFYFFCWVYLQGYYNIYSSSFSFGFALVLPLLSIILGFMAIAGIKKDEKLIRSLDRIR